MGKILKEAFNDFLSPKILMVSFFSFFITICIVFIGFYFAFDGLDNFKEYLFGIANQEEWVLFDGMKDSVIFDFLLKHAIISMILNFLFIIGFGLIIYYIFFMIYSFVIGFFATIVVNEVKSRHYINFELKGIGLVDVVWFYIKVLFVTVVLFIVFIPFYFVPLLNLLVFVPMYYFFYQTLIFDVSSVINSKEELKLVKSNNISSLHLKTASCFAIALVPILGIVLYPFYISYISHFFFIKTESIRQVTIKD